MCALDLYEYHLNSTNKNKKKKNNDNNNNDNSSAPTLASDIFLPSVQACSGKKRLLRISHAVARAWNLAFCLLP